MEGSGLYLSSSNKTLTWRVLIKLMSAALLLLTAAGCGSDKTAAVQPRGPVDVTVITVHPQDVPITIPFIGTTESSHQVEIRSRVEGFLEKKSYEEGGYVKAGQVMFQIDRRPFEAALQQARGELAEQEARLSTAAANLNRIRPLAEKNAVSKKDLDDAVGQEQASRAAVLSAQGKIRDAELKLGYTTIKSPINGFAGRAKKQEGSYISAGTDSLLTYVAKLDPIWVTFSVSENENLKLRDEILKGTVKWPPYKEFAVEVILADGTVFPNKGKLNFADPSFSSETGTYQVRAEIANPTKSTDVLRPGQFLKVNLLGAVRPNAILVPRSAVMQGAKGHFVWIASKENLVELRDVSVSDWRGEDIFIAKGLASGDRVILDNLIKLSPGLPVKAVERTPAAKAAGTSPPSPAKAAATTAPKN